MRTGGMDNAAITDIRNFLACDSIRRCPCKLLAYYLGFGGASPTREEGSQGLGEYKERRLSMPGELQR